MGRYAADVPVLLSSVPLPPIGVLSGPGSPSLPHFPIPVPASVPVSVIADVNITKENIKKPNKNNNPDKNELNTEQKVNEKPCVCNDKNKVDDSVVDDKNSKIKPNKQ